MTVETKGYLYELGEEITGTAKSTGREWVKRPFVIEERGENNTSNLIALEAFGEYLCGSLKDARVGDEIEVTFTVSDRPYNGKWYKDNRVLRVLDVTKDIAPDEPAPKPIDDDLPF